MRKVKVTVTTDGDGAATVYSGPVSGLLHAIRVDDGSGDTSLADTTDIVFTDAETGFTILTITDLTADALYQPRLPIHGANGAATANLYDRVPVDGSIKAVVAQGGDTKTGTLWFYVAED